MRAIEYSQFGGPDVMRLVEVDEPVPGPGEVLVRLHAASVIPGDAKLRAGKLKAIFPIGFPKIPGRDGAGVVTGVGAGVTDLEIGTRVCVISQHMEPGTYAQAIVRDRASIVPMPDALTFEEGAALMHAGVCAWICIAETGQVKSGMRVLVHAGAGAIGGAAIQIARHMGAEVIATCSSRNASYVRSLGAGLVIPYDEADFGETLRDIDVVLDLMGGDVHRRSYPTMKPGGHMVCLISEPFDDRSADFGVRVTMAPIHDAPEALQAVTRLARSGALKPQICDVMPLAMAAEAHRRMEAHEVSRGRLVLRIPQD